MTEAILKLIISFAMLPVQLLLKAWVFIKIWNWFLLEATRFYPSYHLAIGIMILVSFITAKMTTKENPNEKSIAWGVLIVQSLIDPLGWLLVAWVAHLVF